MWKLVSTLTNLLSSSSLRSSRRMSTSPLTWSIESKTWTCTQPNCGPKPNLDMYAVEATIQLSLVKNRQSESYSCFTQNWRPFASKSTSICLSSRQDWSGRRERRLKRNGLWENVAPHLLTYGVFLVSSQSGEHAISLQERNGKKVMQRLRTSGIYQPNKQVNPIQATQKYFWPLCSNA